MVFSSLLFLFRFLPAVLLLYYIAPRKIRNLVLFLFSLLFYAWGKKNLSGDKIREARLKQRLSQSDLAAKVQIAGVTLERDSISRIEIGTRFVTDYELKIFAKVLHVNVEWLLEETEE